MAIELKKISLRGVHALSMDAKGRMAIPARYRTVLADWCDSMLVATIDTSEKCILIYPLPEWEVIQEKIEALSSFNVKTRKIQRLLIGHATDLEIDANGRVLLPSILRDFAVLGKKVVLIGQGKKFELWDEQTWNDRRDSWLDEDVDLDDLPADLMQLSL